MGGSDRNHRSSIRLGGLLRPTHVSRAGGLERWWPEPDCDASRLDHSGRRRGGGHGLESNIASCTQVQARRRLRRTVTHWCRAAWCCDGSPGPGASLAASRRTLGLALDWEIARMSATTIKLRSTLTCPNCGHRETEIMPTDACQFFYDCRGCGAVLRPRSGDCCVYCSYGDTPCPPIQEGGLGRCCT